MRRNKFSLSHGNLLSLDMGELVPVATVEVLPGDSFQHSSWVLTRVSPLLAPVMHRVDVRVHHFFVPLRLVWEDFEDFITGGEDGMDASVYPTITMSTSSGSADVGNLGDYLGVPPDVDGLEVSALPFRAYALIFNELYRDQDLVTALTIDKTSGPDTTTNVDLQNVAWSKDYFTSSRPWQQKGPEVTIPLAGDAPVKGIGAENQVFAQGPVNVYESGGSGTTNYPSAGAKGSVSNSSSDVSFFVREDPDNAGYPGIYADLSAVTGVDINDLRVALAVQRYEEARARFGSRYVEYLRYLGVRSSDARLQRPEYLGGGKQTLQFSEVLQTAPTTSGSELGVADLKGHGIGGLRTNRYRRYFEEHGYVISMLSVLPRTMYVQGLDRTWNRRVKEDYWQRELEHVGQQAVLNKEVYAAHATPNGTFGWQDQYDDYRRMQDRVSGEFRTTALDFWHMGRIFGSDPALNSSFVTSNPTNRIFASSTNDTLWCRVNHSIQARRPLTKTGTSFTF